MAQVLRAGVPRALWVSGFVLAAGGGALCLVLGRLEPLVLVAIGLTLAAFPLFARADAVEIDGPHVRVRRLIWWRGPVDLRQLVALVYRPMTPRSPAAWMLIQRQAGPPLRWYWRLVIGRETWAQLREMDDLRLIELGAGGRLAPLMSRELAEHLSRYVLGTDAIVNDRARAALAGHRSR